MKNISNGVKDSVDSSNVLYELRKAKGSLLALCNELDDFGNSVCRFDDDHSHDSAIWVACAASRDFDTWKFLIYSARDILSDQITAIDSPEVNEEETK